MTPDHELRAHYTLCQIHLFRLELVCATRMETMCHSWGKSSRVSATTMMAYGVQHTVKMTNMMNRVRASFMLSRLARVLNAFFTFCDAAATCWKRNICTCRLKIRCCAKYRLKRTNAIGSTCSVAMARLPQGDILFQGNGPAQ